MRLRSGIELGRGAGINNNQWKKWTVNEPNRIYVCRKWAEQICLALQGETLFVNRVGSSVVQHKTLLVDTRVGPDVDSCFLAKKAKTEEGEKPIMYISM